MSPLAIILCVAAVAFTLTFMVFAACKAGADADDADAWLAFLHADDKRAADAMRVDAPSADVASHSALIDRKGQRDHAR